MKLFAQTLFAAVILAGYSITAMSQTIIIHAGELLSIAGKDPQREMTIVLDGPLISEVRSGFVDPSEFGDDTQLINLKDHFVLPGLIDTHVHLQSELGPEKDSDKLKMSDELVGMRSIHHGMQTLLAGFTTVRDVGSNPQSMYALRDAINKGWVDGPRIIAAGSVGITGGHGDVSGMKPDLLDFNTKRTVCDGPFDCRRATRHAIKYGADLIKITSTGGVLTDRATGTGQQMEMDELKEVVLAARRMGRKVASHAHQEDGIIAALLAGVDSIEHGTYTGPEAIKLFKETSAYLVPTLLAGYTVKKMAEETDFLSPAVSEKAIAVGGDMATNFAKAYKAGVKVAYGTDSGVSKHGENAMEAILLHKAGMKMMDIIMAATINAADLIDLGEQIGTIEVGKRADIIAVDESPLNHIEALLDVDFVMKSGKIYKH